jgi:hypothetical protein
VTHYVTVHNLLRRERGRASDHPCISCGGRAEQWAYQYNGDPELRYEPVGTPYSEDIHGCYAAMCRKCHRKMDTEVDERLRLAVQEGGQRLGALRGSIKANRIVRTCECGLTAHPGAIGMHQKSSGHTRYTDR